MYHSRERGGLGFIQVDNIASRMKQGIPPPSAPLRDRSTSTANVQAALLDAFEMAEALTSAGQSVIVNLQQFGETMAFRVREVVVQPAKEEKQPEPLGQAVVNVTAQSQADMDESVDSTVFDAQSPEQIKNTQVKPWGNRKHLKRRGKRARQGPGSYSELRRR